MHSTRKTLILKATLTAVASLLLSSCAMTVAGGMSVPEDSAATCANHCSSIGMKLSAVAIMADNVGCVCERAKDASEESGGVSKVTPVTAGMATIAMQEAAAQQQKQQQQQQQGK